MKLFFIIFLASSIGGWSAKARAGNNEDLGLYQSSQFYQENITPISRSEKGKNILLFDFTPSFKIFDNTRFGEFSMKLGYGRVFNSSHVVSAGIGIKLVEMIPNIEFGYEYHFLTEGFWGPGLNANVFITVPIFGLGVSAGPFLKMAVLPKIDILLKAGVNTIIPIHSFKIYMEEVSLHAGAQVRWHFL